MVDIFRYTDVAEADVAILNPLSFEKLLLIGALAGLGPDQRQLDLACGKGEMLCQFATRHGIAATGIDIHPPFIELARGRATELGVTDRVDFLVGDAGRDGVAGEFDVVSCIGATWVGGGFSGAIELMRRSLAPGGRLIVGEVFLESRPPADVDDRYHGTLSGISGLGGILDQVEAAGLKLTEMVVASREDWDRYSSRQWDRAERWLRANAEHPDAAGIREWTDRSRRTYLADERQWLGWGVFIISQ